MELSAATQHNTVAHSALKRVRKKKLPSHNFNKIFQATTYFDNFRKLSGIIFNNGHFLFSL